jgi:hypothetical protein
LRTPPNTSLAVESTTVTRGKEKRKATAAPVPSEPRMMDDRTRGASSDVEPRRPIHSKQQSNNGEEEEEEEEEKEDMTVKDLMERMSHFESKISMKLMEIGNYTG